MKAAKIITVAAFKRLLTVISPPYFFVNRLTMVKAPIKKEWLKREKGRRREKSPPPL